MRGAQGEPLSPRPFGQSGPIWMVTGLSSKIAEAPSSGPRVRRSGHGAILRAGRGKAAGGDEAMKLETFEMERFQSVWENRVTHNLSESGVHPMAVEELLSPDEVPALLRQRLVYVQTNGTPELRDAIATLYPGAAADNVVVGNGTAEANYVAIWRLVEPGDEVVLMLPNYMQIWGVVRGHGAVVRPWHLREDRGWTADVDELETLVSTKTRLIAVCNPNNPTGSILSEDAMRAIVRVAE